MSADGRGKIVGMGSGQGDDRLRELLDMPDELLVEDCPDGPLPGMFLKAKREEWLKYVARLSAAEMCVAVPASAVPSGPNGEPLGAGTFPVPKTADEDRAVTDRRRKNWAEKKVRPPRLPVGLWPFAPAQSLCSWS